VRAHEIHIARRDAGGRHGAAQGVLQAAAFRVGRRDVRAVAAAGVAQQPTEPAPGLTVARQEHQAGGLAQEEPVAAAVERAYPLARQGAQRIEAAHHEAAEDVVATGHDEIGGVAIEQVGADAERGRARRTRRGYGEHRSPGRQAPGERVRRAVVEPGRRCQRSRRIGESALELFHSAEGRAQHHGDPRRIRGERGAREEIVSGRQHQRGGAAARRRPVAQRRELLDLAATADSQIGDVEPLDPARPVDAGHQRRPEAVEVETERRGDTRRDDRNRRVHRDLHTS
jgi:hypothetical protein